MISVNAIYGDENFSLENPLDEACNFEDHVLLGDFVEQNNVDIGSKLSARSMGRSS